MRHFLSVTDLTVEEIYEIYEISDKLKTENKLLLAGKTLVLIFEKPSLRTRVTFEVAMTQLGGNTIYLSKEDVQPGRRESISDISRNLSRWVDIIVMRTFSHDIIVKFAEDSSVPVINGLTDLEHPCQALSDFYTIYKRFYQEFPKVKVAWVGDGNNVCHSLLLLSAMFGANISIATPPQYQPDKEIIKKANEIAKKTGAQIYILSNPIEAVKDSDIIYTDVWTSMGKESECEIRIKHFKDYQVNKKLLSLAKESVVVMHCLPARRGEEITSEVLDGKNSIVLLQAENRLHIQKALLLYLLKKRDYQLTPSLF